MMTTLKWFIKKFTLKWRCRWAWLSHLGVKRPAISDVLEHWPALFREASSCFQCSKGIVHLQWALSSFSHPYAMSSLYDEVLLQKTFKEERMNYRISYAISELSFQVVHPKMKILNQTVAGTHWLPYYGKYYGVQWQPAIVWLPTCFIFCVQQNNKIHTGLEQLERE